MQSYLQGEIPYRNTTVINNGQSGWDTTLWLASGGAAITALIAQNKAIATGQTNPIRLASIMLGTNNWREGGDPVAYGNDMRTICGLLIAGGLTPILHYFPYGNRQGGETRILPMLAQIDPICNGSTIIQGDKLLYQVTANNWPEWYQGYPSVGASGTTADNIHPLTQQGVTAIASLHSRAIANHINGASGVVAGGGFSGYMEF
jgi:hypothetical protein